MYKASEKIRQELQNYYQRIVKNRFADKLAQILKTSLQEELDYFDERFESFSLKEKSYSTEVQSNETDSKLCLKDYQNKVSKIDRKIRDLQKVKDKLQRLHLQ
jgi:hypothetical protein